METSRPVIVKRLPARMNRKTAREFMSDMNSLITKDRPQVVLDLSLVEQLDAGGVEVLLQCMNEAMRRDGDVKLAAPTAHAAAVLEITRTDRLFEIFPSSTEAVRSYSSFLPNFVREHQTLKPQPVPQQPPAAA